MLAQLLRTLLGSEPCIAIEWEINLPKDRQELIDALRQGSEDGLFSFTYTMREAFIYPHGKRYGLSFSQQPIPTVRYNPYSFTVTRL